MNNLKMIRSDLDWMDVKNVSRSTVNKAYSDVEVTTDFRRKMIISEHSPIRLLKFRFRFENMKSWVATHLSRHSWECFISTQRSDRTGVNRDELPQGQLVNFEGEMNVQHLIDTGRKRLCQKASPETRDAMLKLKNEISNIDYDIARAIVPNCIYRMGCPEFEPCTHFREFLVWVTYDNLWNMTNLDYRLDAYSQFLKHRR